MRRLFLYTTLLVSGASLVLTIATSAAAPSSPAAVGLRVFRNEQGLSAFDWYAEKCAARAFPTCGKPKPVVVDGYDGIRDGNTVYVGAANIASDGSVHTNIYLLSLAENAGAQGEEIFDQLLAGWKFNTNTGLSLETKGKLRRDVRRKAHLMSIRRVLEAYKQRTGRYPDLAAGSYIRNMSLSLWPSWQETLGKALGATLPSDRGVPFERTIQDPANPQRTKKVIEWKTTVGCADPYHPTTCWDERAAKMGCPAELYAYWYKGAADGSSYTLRTVYEPVSLPGSWQPSVGTEGYLPGELQQRGYCTPKATCGNNSIEGNEQCDGFPHAPNVEVCGSCTIVCRAGFHGAPDASGVIRMCVVNSETRQLQNRFERRTWNTATSQWGDWIVQSCSAGYVLRGNDCVQEGALLWKQEALAAWSPRRLHASVAFGGKMWVLGGQRSTGILLNDVWSSSDGATWTQATASAPWSARLAHTVVVFNDGSGEKMWVLGGVVIGGFVNDVWSSSDGVTWTQVTASAPWSARAYHAATVFNGKMWVLGGIYSSEVWSSSNGSVWTRASVAPWSGRYGHTVVVFNGKMWVLGGMDSSRSLNDVWSSSDGVTWTRVTASAAWSDRRGHTSVVFNGKMWVLGGEAFPVDVWSSSDGSVWTKGSAPPWTERAWHTSVFFGNKMWVMGGAFGGTLNDVWHTPP